jgi:ankyrin repeat protein
MSSEPDADDPRAALAHAVIANDLDSARRELARHPDLKAHLDEPMPGVPFDGVLLGPATRWENREMIDLLLDAGADINARSRWWAGGFGVLDTCNPSFAPFLIERGARVDAHAAARLGRLEALTEVVEADGAAVHARGGDGQTPLHFAASVEIARFLLSHGADVDAKDVDHESTPAQYMVSDRQDVARFLVARGCRTDILLAAALGDLNLTKRHLDANSHSVRTTVSDEFFPMRDARAGGHIYIWTLGKHRTPHLVARHFGHHAIVELLMAHSPDALRLTVACELGDEDAVRSLGAAHADLVRNLAPADQRKLVDAAENNNTAAVRLMLGAGWPVDATGTHGATALHFAAWLGNLQMTRDILRCAPPLEAADADYHMTPIGWAVHGSKHSWRCQAGEYAAVVEALLDAGAVTPPVTDAFNGSDAVLMVLRRSTG